MNVKKEMIVSGKIKKRRRKGLTINELELYSLCAIPMILVFVFCYLPMGGIIIAFKDYKFNKGIFGSDWIGFRNFEFFLKSNDFARITWNTLSLNFIFIVCGTVAAIVVAIMLFELKSRNTTKTFQTILIIPYFLSWVIVSYMAYALLNPQYGIINGMLEKIGIGKVDWYALPKAWPPILTIASIWKGVGMSSVIYYASLMGIDVALFEAAEIDGTTKWQRTKYIIIPSLIPLITILTILSIGNIFRADFGLFYQLTRDVGQLYSKTDVIDTYIFRTMRIGGDMGMSSAVGLMQSIVGFILVIVTNYCSKKIEPDNALF